MVFLGAEEVCQIVRSSPQSFAPVVFATVFGKLAETFVNVGIVRVFYDYFFQCNVAACAQSEHGDEESPVGFGVKDNRILVCLVGKERSERHEHHGAYPHAEPYLPRTFLCKFHAGRAYYVV